MDLFYIFLVHTNPDPRIPSSTAAAPDDWSKFCYNSAQTDQIKNQE